MRGKLHMYHTHPLLFSFLVPYPPPCCSPSLFPFFLHFFRKKRGECLGARKLRVFETQRKSPSLPRVRIIRRVWYPFPLSGNGKGGGIARGGGLLTTLKFPPHSTKKTELQKLPSDHRVFACPYVIKLESFLDTCLLWQPNTVTTWHCDDLAIYVTLFRDWKEYGRAGFGGAPDRWALRQFQNHRILPDLTPFNNE